jgi:hypothetical protein
MKTHPTTAANTASNRIARTHSFMVIAGIIIAIICSIVLLQDAYAPQHAEAKETGIAVTSKLAINHQIQKVKEMTVLSVMSLLK